MRSDDASLPAAGLARPTLPLPLWEFVGMIAAMMALNALAIDTMLPALHDIARSYSLQQENDQQLVIFAYVAGFGAPQLVFGPVSDSFGRKRVVLGCIVAYTIAAFFCMGVTSFTMLLATRFFQGIAASGIRVIAVSVVRDLMGGRAMARIMSLVMTVFMVVPILAPSVGQGVMLLASWQWTFGVLGLAGIGMFIWIWMRLPETLSADNRQPLNFKASFRAYRTVVTTRETLGYMCASGVLFGALFAYVASSEQVFRDVFDKTDTFVLWFAGIACVMSGANFMNSRIVERLGQRRVSHTVLLVFLAISSLNTVLMMTVGEKLAIFYPLFAVTFACFGMIGANFSSLAMEPLGRIAGTGSAAYGFMTTTVASFFGWMVASRFDGSVVPILEGYIGLGLTCLVIVLVTERGKLFGTREDAL
ncbi:multidrug effflux MFS transporter [Henriciella aquimarina]|uniref:multidrug effflux MFS transporter n=1 Tax=Henriciella aquimarina TaxID=545261 RepID=UPI000A03E9E5|nr:multidrug effflux MFS transporter [Henriciella aquimarina]